MSSSTPEPGSAPVDDGSEFSSAAANPMDSFPAVPSSKEIRDAAGEGFSPVPAVSASDETPADNFSMDAFLGYQPPESESAPSVEGGGEQESSLPIVEIASAEAVSAEDPLGLSAYANSEISSAKDGPLLFRIFISGIDSKELREFLYESIDDSRFAWDPNELMAQINKGHLIIDKISPVKATILINRIKRLPIQIRWEQYSITQM